MRWQTHEHLHRLELDVVSSHGVAELCSFELRTIVDEEILSELIDILLTDVFDDLLCIATAGCAIEAVVLRVPAVALIQKGSLKPGFGRLEVFDGTEHDFGVLLGSVVGFSCKRFTRLTKCSTRFRCSLLSNISSPDTKFSYF